MKNMDDSITQPHERAPAPAPPGWKTVASAIAAILLGLLFVVAGVWKITDPFGAAQRLVEARVPGDLSLLAACLLGVGETFAGVLIVVPRFRRWGAWLTGLLLVAFLIYIGVNYSVLRGEECNCFPWVRRAIGPAFFIGDVVMLLLAVVAGLWARPSQGLRCVVLVLLAVGVFAAISYGVNARLEASVQAPESIQVGGKPFPLRQGRVLIYFFDPECLHCRDGARELARLPWRDVKIVAVATEQPQFAQDFLDTTGLHAPLSDDVALLRNTFSFVDTPYAVALERGRQREAFSDFEPGRLRKQLRGLGFIE
jgi:uncharacterized membrane protein YphA (DoxX/SURF4 family)